MVTAVADRLTSNRFRPSASPYWRTHIIRLFVWVEIEQSAKRKVDPPHPPPPSLPPPLPPLCYPLQYHNVIFKHIFPPKPFLTSNTLATTCGNHRLSTRGEVRISWGGRAVLTVLCHESPGWANRKWKKRGCFNQCEYYKSRVRKQGGWREMNSERG